MQTTNNKHSVSARRQPAEKQSRVLPQNSGSHRCAREDDSRRGFTLIETLIAISLLMLAVVEPMTLTAQALKSAYYARDQITASNLAQEAIESVRSVRDGQILKIAEGVDPSADIFGPIPVDQDFRVDTVNNNTMTRCSTDPGGVCIPLQTNGILYGYNPGWANTGFTRTVHASYVAGTTDEIHLQVTITWRTGSYPARSIMLYENLYRWVQ